MSDDPWNQPPGDFADEPTDPGRVVGQPGQPQTQPGAVLGPGAPAAQQPGAGVSNLGFRPQTGAFGAVGGPPSPAEQANPFGHPGSSPNYSGAGQASFQGPSSGQFTPPGANPSGAFNANTGEFPGPQVNTGSFPAPNAGKGAAGQPGQPGAFAPPLTGGFNAVSGAPVGPGQQPSGPSGQFAPVSGGQSVGQPGPTGQFAPVPGGTGAFQNVPGATGTFQAPQGQPLQIGELQDEPPEPTIKVRATFGLGGLFMGAIVGLALGLLNSLIEGVGVLQGMSVTLQISLWFGGTIALICAWKPDKVWETLEGYGFFD